MMIGDDEVQAEAARGFRFGKGAHAGIDRDDEAHAVGIRRFKHARLQAVALAQPVGHVKAHHAAQHFDGGLQQHHGGGAVHVVVAVEQNRLARRDGALHALHGRHPFPASAKDRGGGRHRD